MTGRIGMYERASLYVRTGHLTVIGDPTAYATTLMHLEDYFGSWAPYKYTRLVNESLARLFRYGL